MERLAGHGHELPIVAGGMQVHLQHAVGVGVVEAAVRDGRVNGVMARAARADDELANALQVQVRAGVLWGEALVVVVVPIQDHVHARAVQVARVDEQRISSRGGQIRLRMKDRYLPRETSAHELKGPRRTCRCDDDQDGGDFRHE